MSTSRQSSARLLRLLAGTAAPAYALDSARRIVYCNEACAAWLGAAAEELVGAACNYHSAAAPESREGRAAGLCPPPEALAGSAHQGFVSRTGESQVSRRRATFVSLPRTDASEAAMLVVLSPHDEPAEAEPAAADSEPTADQLHAAIGRFRAAQAARFRLDVLLGRSPAMERVRRQAALAAGCRESVAVCGPRGSGRAALAKAIHYAGALADRPLVPLECGLLGPELLRTTLAALVAGSAVADACGRGALLLVELDAAPPEIQPELAAILSRPNLGYRLLATAAAPLDQAAAAGRLRPELASLASTITLELPPLSARPEDLALVAQALLEAQNATGGKQLGGFTPEALDRLAAWPWPGDLAELAGVVREAHARAAGPLVSAADLPGSLQRGLEPAPRRRRLEPIDLEAFLKQIERELLERALALSKGNKAKAARLLGLNRPRLYRRMVQLGLAVDRAEGPREPTPPSA